MQLPDLIGVLGDIHCETAALEAALELFRREGAGKVLSVGDVCDGPGDLARIIELLDAAKVDVVCGNHERWLEAGEMRTLPDATPAGEVSPKLRRWLRALPVTRRYTSAAGRVLLCHGVADDDMTMLTGDDFGYALEVNDPLQELLAAHATEIMIGGHTHRRMVRQLGEIVFINAGTLARQHSPCVVMIELRAREVREFDWRDDHFERGAVKNF